MDLDFWHQRWQANLIGFHQKTVNNHLLGCWPQLQLEEGSRILVPLCGNSLDMMWLLEKGHPVVGIEVSQVAVESFFEENRLSPAVHEERYGRRYVVDQLELLCADFFSLEPVDIGAVNAFYDRAALIALPPAQRPGYCAQLKKLLGHNISGLLVTLEYNQAEMDGPPFSVPREEVCSLFDTAFTLKQLFQFDALDENQKFRKKGVTQLTELTYHLRSKQTSVEP